MGFQIDETCMAPNRAIITRNRIEEDISMVNPVKNKPGMMHYVISSRRLWLSVDPHSINEDGIDKTKVLYEVITDQRLKEELNKMSSAFSTIENNTINGYTFSSEEEPTTNEKVDIIKMINELNEKINNLSNDGV